MAEEQPDETTDDQPKIFKSLTAWIGGVTGVIVALGGLASASGIFFSGRDSSQEEVRTKSGAPVVQDEQNAISEELNAATQSAQEEQPTSYKTDDGGTLSSVDGLWVWTTNDGEKYRYKELSNDSATTVAVLKGGGEDGADVYLRWPNAGGQAFQSFDEQATWTDPVKLTRE